jgi:hypothetical protein
MNIDEMIEVLQAFKDGEQIQSKVYEHDIWHDDNEPKWGFKFREYRVKPKPIERWLYLCPNGEDAVFKSKDKAYMACANKKNIIRMVQVDE